jgi:hypothetical protein
VNYAERFSVARSDMAPPRRLSDYINPILSPVYHSPSHLSFLFKIFFFIFSLLLSLIAIADRNLFLSFRSLFSPLVVSMPIGWIAIYRITSKLYSSYFPVLPTSSPFPPTSPPGCWRSQLSAPSLQARSRCRAPVACDGPSDPSWIAIPHCAR